MAMSRTTKIWNISLPPIMAKEAESVAKKESRTKSELVREALRQYIWSSKWKNLRSYAQKKAKELNIQEKDIEQIIEETRK